MIDERIISVSVSGLGVEGFSLSISFFLSDV